MDTALGNRLIELRARIVDGFDAGNWEEIGLLTGATELITCHSRLLRSLSWGDEDYAGNVLTVLRRIVERDPRTLPIIEAYLDKHFPAESTYVSAKPSERRITFAPYVFQVPDVYVELDLVAVMMPFSMEFTRVYEAIKRATSECSLRCLRADDIWEDPRLSRTSSPLFFARKSWSLISPGRTPMSCTKPVSHTRWANMSFQFPRALRTCRSTCGITECSSTSRTLRD